MSLPDYYSILQVPVTATGAEIKTAYRRLAKIFHPDKNHGNPAAEEKFKQVKEAYEILSNPLRRRKYDEKRNLSLSSKHPSSSFQKKTGGKKNYSFTEEEAKRRQYYQQHYKTSSYAEAAKKQEEKKQTGSTSSELKYILISVPLAVALLLLIIRLYEKPKAALNKTPGDADQRSAIYTAESPYTGALGKNIFDSTSKPVIKIVNKSGSDAIVFLLNDSMKTVRHHFIENNYRLFMEKIPAARYRFYYWLGKRFRGEKFLLNDITGNFTESTCVKELADTFIIRGGRADTFPVYLSGENCRGGDPVLLKKIFKRN